MGRNRPHEAKSRPFGGPRRPWGHVSRSCLYCGTPGPRVQVLGGYAHRRCINEKEAAKKVKRPPLRDEGLSIEDRIHLECTGHLPEDF